MHFRALYLSHDYSQRLNLKMIWIDDRKFFVSGVLSDNVTSIIIGSSQTVNQHSSNSNIYLSRFGWFKVLCELGSFLDQRYTSNEFFFQVIKTKVLKVLFLILIRIFLLNDYLFLNWLKIFQIIWSHSGELCTFQNKSNDYANKFCFIKSCWSCISRYGCQTYSHSLYLF